MQDRPAPLNNPWTAPETFVEDVGGGVERITFGPGVSAGQALDVVGRMLETGEIPWFAVRRERGAR